MRLSEAIDCALEILPRICLPVHDDILRSPGSAHIYPAQVLESEGIKFSILEIDTLYQFSFRHTYLENNRISISKKAFG